MEHDGRLASRGPASRRLASRRGRTVEPVPQLPETTDADDEIVTRQYTRHAYSGGLTSSWVSTAICSSSFVGITRIVTGE